MNELLSRFRAILIQSGFLFDENISDGISREEIFKVGYELGIQFTQDVIDLYTWRNGTKNPNEKRIGEMTLFSNGIFSSIEESKGVYEYYTVKWGIWPKGYFPIFGSGGGDYLLLNLNKDDKTSDMILIYSPPILLSVKPVTIYDSLHNLVDSVIKCYDAGAYYFSNNMLESGVDLEFKICSENNPKSEYWHHQDEI